MNKNKRYKETGKCIWCGNTEVTTSFETAPHILPRRLGGTEIGFDVCDDCNHYFGTAPKGKVGVPSIDHALKEIFGAFRMFGKNLNSQSYRNYTSSYFSYRHKERTIKIRNNYNSKAITTQFKRGLYEIFLQKYHYLTKDGNNQKFDFVRNFARYGIGNPHIYYAFNNVILAPGEGEMNNPTLHMSEKLVDDMNKYGFFNIWIFGHNFYIEVFPILAIRYHRQYLQMQADTTLLNAKGNEAIFEFTDVSQIDFLMQRFNS